MKQYIKIIISNLFIALILIIAYSPGFIGLRPSDISIFRAGMSILTAPLCIAAMITIDKKLLFPKQPDYICSEETLSIEQAKSLLKSFDVPGMPFIDTVHTAIEQLSRLQAAKSRTIRILNARFEPGSLSNEKFVSAIENASKTAIQNIITMVNRLPLFDADDYERLKNYKHDNIPDDIQEEQIAFYNQIKKHAEETIIINEKIITRMASLIIRCSEPDSETNDSQQIIDQINQLTDELKYYK